MLGLAVVAGSYYVAAQLGLRLAVVGNDVTPLWPATGVAVVALLALGRRVWPAIGIAAFAVNAPISPNIVATLLISVGNTIAPLVAMYLLVRVDFRPQVNRVRDALALVFLGALASMLVSASIGSFTLLLANEIDRGDFFEAWSVWWAGDAMGVLIVAPFLWSLRVPDLRAIRWDRVVEVILLFATLATMCVLAMRGPEGTLVLVLPILGWIAWRFQLAGAAPAALLASVIVTTAAAHDVGPFVGESLATQMILLQSFNASVAFTCVLFASAVAEHEQLVEREKHAQRDLYQRERRVAETLQRSLMPERLPEPVSVAVASRYLPASTEAAIGGDWYDIISLPDNRLGLVIGDVAGHGVSAAATMGQLRMALRAYALDSLSPAVALEQLNRLMRELQPGAMATVLYAQLDPESHNLCFASAGHPPPLLIVGPHEARYLEHVQAPPLGVTPEISVTEGTTWMQAGATLVLYTDGLVERRTASIDERLRLLRLAAGDGPDDLQALCDHLIARLLDVAPADDVALLAVRPLALAGTRLVLRRPARPDSVAPTRRAIAHWLHENGVCDDIAFNVIVATTEAYTNAVLHAYGVAEGTVEVEGVISSAAIHMTVRDAGSWKPPSDAHDGCGLMMMQALMTSVDLHPSDCGTEVSLRCDLDVGSRRG